jgi:type IV pilus assembly protein PilQ
MMRKNIWAVIGLLLLTSRPASAADGKVSKIELTPDGQRVTLVIEHSGEGKFRLFKSELRKNVIIEAENLSIPPALTKLLDLSSKKGPVLQMTPYNSQHSGHAMAKLVVQLRGSAKVSSTEVPGRYIVEIQKKEETLGAQASAADEITGHESANLKSADVARRLIDVLGAPEDDKHYFGSKVTFEGKNVEIPDIFRLVGESSNLNIIWDPDVEGQQTNLSVNDLPWDQLLDIVVQQKGFKATVMGNVVRIMTGDTFAKQEEAKKAELTLSNELEPIIMAVIPLGFKPAGEMKTLILDLIQQSAPGAPGIPGAGAAAGAAAVAGVSSGQLNQDFVRGKVDVDDRTNSLVITNTKDAIERIRRLVKELDVPVPQILIDSKIVVASEQFTKSIGVAWAYAATSSSGIGGTIGTTNGYQPWQFTSPPPPPGTPATTSYTPFVISSAPGTSTVAVQLGTTASANIAAALSLSEIDSLTKTVASPRVVVDNNHVATISDGQSIIIAPPPTALGTQSPPTTVTANLSLSVTPQVTTSGAVEMKGLNVTKNDIGPLTSQGNTTTTNKTLTTDVLVDSGSTLVLGGVYQLSNQKSSQGIPLLKDLPFIGQLFRMDQKQDTKDELMVFITPQILDPLSKQQSL